MPEANPNPLAGKRIVITRAMTDSEELAGQISRRGAIPLVFPLISFAVPEDFGPLDAAIDEFAQFDWIILTSVRAVRAVSDRAKGSGRSLRPPGCTMRAACVGPVTAEAAREAGFAVAFVAETHNGVALVEEMGSTLDKARILLPRSDHANPDLPAALKKVGADVTEVIAYRTVRPKEVDQKTSDEIKSGEIDAVLIFSPSAVKSLVSLVDWPSSLFKLQDKALIVAVGPVTAKALREGGFTRLLVASNTTTSAVIEALEEHFAGVENQASAGAKRA